MSLGQPEPNIPRSTFAAAAPHIAFATCIAGWIAWYCWDAWHANAAIENMILILPVSLIGVVLYAFVLIGHFRRAERPAELPAQEHKIAARGAATKIFGSMLLLAAFVVAGPLIGFDVATFAYMLLMMAFLGERRIVFLLLVPTLFSLAVIYGFTSLLSTPLPVLILRGSFS